MVVENLVFFDKNGYNLNLNWNEQKHIWEGNIFFPRVSVGLYENTTIYAVEYVGQDVNSDDDYSYPTGEGNIVFQWDLANKFVDEFFMFDFDDDYELKDTSSLVYTPYDGPLCETLIINRFEKYNAPLLGSSQNIEHDDLLEIHVAFISNENSAETTYRRTLVMSYENGYVKREIARITFFAETIEEDERLKIWNENLGYNLKEEDTIIFKQSDMHEYMPDFELLNEKRKELMLEGHNIYPYIGSYKAILNAIKFFGYDNLNIVEYWRNINEFDSEFGKIYRTYVYSLKNKKTLSTKRKPISLNTNDFQKLSNISLVYNINHPEKDEETGKKYDEYGLPNVIEDFDKSKRDDFILTIEEALVKLFALKKKLNNEFMPGSTKITDVIGEGNYFSINLIGNNPQISSVNYAEAKGYVDFTVFPDKYCYITENEDFARYIAEKKEMHVDASIRDVANKTIEEIGTLYADSDSDWDMINEIDTRSLGNIIDDLMESENDSVCEYYEEYYNITYDNKFGDAQEYGLREMPEARNVYEDIVLDDFPNENKRVPDIVVCAKAILKGKFSENIDGTSAIKWRIIYTTDPTIENKEWEYYGDVKTFGNVFVQLPYLGNYDVEMSVWDVYNHCCKQYTKDAIIVEPYNIDIRGFYYDARPLPDGLKYDLMIPQEYLDNVEKEYKYYLWANEEKSVITYKSKASEITLSDIVGVIDGNVNNTNFEKEELETYLENLRDVDEDWVSIVNNVNSEEILQISWIHNDGITTTYGVDVFNYIDDLDSFTYDDSDSDSDNDKLIIPFDENDSYAPEWNKDELYHVIKKNVDNMYHWALQEHLGGKDKNSTMRNYRPDGSVSFEGPYYKYDVDNILYKIEKGYKEFDHLNKDIIDLKPGKHYEYVRYINNIVDIKPLTWVLLGFDYTRITGRYIGRYINKEFNKEYPRWTLTMLGDELDPDEDLRKDKEITTHNGLYFTYLFEEEGVYKIKLEILDINGNEYVIEKPIIIVDKDANYEMYHTLKDEYDKYLEAKNERSLVYLT